jgi:DNA-binding beta-propeller fold protein YncE
MALRFLLSILLLALLLSCSRSLHPSGGPANLVIYPAPPDTTRIQFLAHFTKSVDVGTQRGWFKRLVLGSEDVKTIGKPYGVAISKGKIYICDTFKKGFDIIDLNKNSFTEFIPTGLGALKVPLNCFVDEQGNLYVADADRKQIVVFNEKGEYRSCFGEKDDFKPTDVFVKDGKIWVPNMTGHQVNVYSQDSSHRLLYRFPEIQPDSVGHLYSPTNIFVSPEKVYVTDFGDFKVKVYSHDGKIHDTIGTFGESIGQFARPKGVAADRDGNVYVVDAGFENTQIFNKDGKLLMFFGGSYKGPGDMWLPAKVVIDYDNLPYFQKYVDPAFHLKYVILVTNQFGPDKLNIYGYVEPMTPALKEQMKTKK